MDDLSHSVGIKAARRVDIVHCLYTIHSAMHSAFLVKKSNTTKSDFVLPYHVVCTMVDLF